MKKKFDIYKLSCYYKDFKGRLEELKPGGVIYVEDINEKHEIIFSEPRIVNLVPPLEEDK